VDAEAHLRSDILLSSNSGLVLRSQGVAIRRSHSRHPRTFSCWPPVVGFAGFSWTSYCIAMR